MCVAQTQKKKPVKDDNSEISEESHSINHQGDQIEKSLPEAQNSKHYWQTKGYWNLPEKARKAIDQAKLKSKHSDFWYRLQNVNDKILVFKEIYYEKEPRFEKHFNQKK